MNEKQIMTHLILKFISALKAVMMVILKIILLKVLLRKSKHWDYECEWRIIEQPETRTDEPGNRNYKLQNGMLTGIIFGCEMSPDDKDTIRFLLKDRLNQIKLYQAKKRENEFALEIAETD